MNPHRGDAAVVAQPDRTTEFRLEVGLERHIAPVEVWRKQNGRAVGTDRARRTDAHPFAFRHVDAGEVRRTADGLDNARGDALVAQLGLGFVFVGEQAVMVAIEHPGENLCPPKIHPDVMFLRHRFQLPNGSRARCDYVIRC